LCTKWAGPCSEWAAGHDFDYYNEDSILHQYYPECCRLVQEATGADMVVAFDHNLRSAQGSVSGRTVNGGNAWRRNSKPSFSKECGSWHAFSTMTCWAAPSIDAKECGICT